MKRATAQAIAPEALFLDRAPEKEHQALHEMAQWLLQFTPNVTHPEGNLLTSPPKAPQACGLVLEVQGSLQLFGGQQALLTKLRTGLIQLGYSAHTALAPCAYGAWLLAQHADGIQAATPAHLNARLAPLPVQRLVHAQPHLAVLTQIGARTLKEISQLPRAGLARRFGPDLLDELDRAYGRNPDLTQWVEPVTRFDAKLELMAQVEHAEALLFAAQRLILQLTGWLTAIQQACTLVALHIEHDDLPPSCIEVRLSEASREAARLTLLLRERLERFVLPAPAHTLRLSCPGVQPLAASTQELFPTTQSPRESLGRLLERLQSRLGNENVQMLQLIADHRPECACKLVPVPSVQSLTGASASVQEPSATYGPGLPRPLWLLSSPVAISERNNRPWWQGPLHLLAGPERIESGWWDGHLVQRDYFVAQDEGYALYWVFRERLPTADGTQGWYLHGCFG
jgi:protein ImuB